MGLFDRFRRTADAPAEQVRALPDPGEETDLPLTPESRRLTAEERARIERALERVQADGVDPDDLASIGAGLDAALQRWQREGGDPEPVVEGYAAAIGEHLTRTTDLRWEVATDVFGTDLAVASGDFVVVPQNLVAVRWMRRETGWVHGVVGHLVQVRARGRS